MKRLLPLLLVFLLTSTACEESPESKVNSASATTPTEAGAPTETSGESGETGETGGAPANGPSGRCEQAYSDLQALVAGLEEQLGSSDSDLPDRASFLESCRSLPGEIQDCMVFEYAMAHQKECESRVEALDPAERTKAQELMGK